MRKIAVVDIGKSNAKLLAVDLQTGVELVVAKCDNSVRRDGPYPHFDEARLWDFALAALRGLALGQAIDAIVVTTHGAAAALVGDDGDLVLPILDYEHDGPDETAAPYGRARPDFAETGSPRLPGGLNLGAQIFWLATRFPDRFAQARHLLTYPQYWAFRLSGVASCEATSLGCHTDLWNPWRGQVSSLVEHMGWRGLLPPLRPAAAVLGTVLHAVAAATGLSPDTPVLCGIHDSNASLVAHLGAGPRAVLSTGTWMIVMALGGRGVTLDPQRDVLVNVNARGAPVPTARYMAGREFDMITAGRVEMPDAAVLDRVLDGRTMALPSLHPETGPFPGLALRWLGAEPAPGPDRVAAASFYAALMAAECLTLVGAEGPVVVEGPFGGNAAFLRMLATATGRSVLAAGQGAGTGLGAALLAGPLAGTRVRPDPILPEASVQWRGYAAQWQAEVARAWKAQAR